MRDLDPLYVIFEQHLYNFQDSSTDRKTFIGNIVQDYVTYLRSVNVAIPKQFEQAVMEELSHQVNEMFVKKIYGCLSIDEFRNGLRNSEKRSARTRYSRLQSAKSRRR